MYLLDLSQGGVVGAGGCSVNDWVNGGCADES